MANGADLTFPAVTTGGQVALVANEYSQLLIDAANERRVVYLLEMLAIWLLPVLCLLVAAPAVRLVIAVNVDRFQRDIGHSRSVMGGAANSTIAIGESRNINDSNIMASGNSHGAFPAY
jgi:hypothetical protein